MGDSRLLSQVRMEVWARYMEILEERMKQEDISSF